MKPRDVIEQFNRVLELLDELQLDPAVPDYFVFKAETMVEDIETLLGQTELDE